MSRGVTFGEMIRAEVLCEMQELARAYVADKDGLNVVQEETMDISFRGRVTLSFGSWVSTYYLIESVRFTEVSNIESKIEWRMHPSKDDKLRVDDKLSFAREEESDRMEGNPFGSISTWVVLEQVGTKQAFDEDGEVIDMPEYEIMTGPMARLVKAYYECGMNDVTMSRKQRSARYELEKLQIEMNIRQSA